jgi:phospholipase/carboxylesterase
MNLLHAAHVPPGEGPFPLILTLHGWGANAHDLLGLAPLLHRGEALVLSPQGPVVFEIAQGVPGYGWFPITGGGPPSPAEFERGRRELATFLDEAVERYPVDRRKIVVLGFSQGGVMAYDMVLRDPDRFCGLVAISSWLPPDLVGEGLAKQSGHENFPVLVQHGTEDPMIPVARAQESREALLKLGVNLAYHEYEMGHEIRPEALRDLLVWLEEKCLTTIMLA